MSTALRLSGLHHAALMKHLYPGDGLEAVAFGVCGRHSWTGGEILMIQKIIPVPHAVCRREVDRVTWPTAVLVPLLDPAKQEKLAVVKFHSHPNGYEKFSSLDGESDNETFGSIFAWLGQAEPHASAVLLPDGRVFGRAISEDASVPLSVTIIGDNISYLDSELPPEFDPAIFERQEQLFGAGTTKRLRKLRIAIVGCSGTGSVVIELLARLGVGTLILIDDDKVEKRNVNRILNSAMSDVTQPKVDILAERVRGFGLGTKVVPLRMNLFNPEAVRAVASSDAVFGCMDTAEGRHLLNRIATFYLIPYIDLGVHLRADGAGGIDEASGVVHYLQPGGSSLLSRGSYTLARVLAENLYRTNPEEYAAQRRAGYIEGVNEDSPAVVSVNTAIASLAVNEFLARVHPFRSCYNSDAAIIRMNFMETFIAKETDGNTCGIFARHVGRGDVEPLLDMPSLSS